DDRKEARRAQSPQQLVDLFFAAEEKMILVRLERTKAWEWIERRHPFKRAMIGSHGSGVTPSYWAMTVASWLRKRCFSGVCGASRHTVTGGAGFVRPYPAIFRSSLNLRPSQSSPAAPKKMTTPSAVRRLSSWYSRMSASLPLNTG